MEFYARKVSIFDQKIMDNFAEEHKKNKEMTLAGDCSLILGKNYMEFDSFYVWYKQAEQLNQEKHLKKGQVGCTTYLILRKEDDYLIALLDIRHSLTFPHGEIYGHIGLDIRPSERKKGYCYEILKLAQSLLSEFSISKVVVSCEYSNLASKRGIEKVFGKECQYIPCEGTYYLVYEKKLN